MNEDLNKLQETLPEFFKTKIESIEESADKEIAIKKYADAVVIAHNFASLDELKAFSASPRDEQVQKFPNLLSENRYFNSSVLAAYTYYSDAVKNGKTLPLVKSEEPIVKSKPEEVSFVKRLLSKIR